MTQEERETFVAVFRNLVGVLNTEDELKELALLIIGATLCAFNMSAKGIGAFYRAARESSSIADSVETELARDMYQNIDELYSFGPDSNIYDAFLNFKELFAEIKEYETSQAAQI